MKKKRFTGAQIAFALREAEGGTPVEQIVASEKNECWSMDFMSDQLFDGRRLRLLTIVDNHTRKSLAIRSLATGLQRRSPAQQLRQYPACRIRRTMC